MCLQDANIMSFKVRIMVFNTNFDSISVLSWKLVLLVKETGVPWENHLPAARHWRTWSHNIVSSTSCLSEIRTPKVSGDRHWSKLYKKPNYHPEHLPLLAARYRWELDPSVINRYFLFINIYYFKIKRVLVFTTFNYQKV